TLPMELGAVLIQNNTGAIVGFVGGRENKMQYSQVNHALDSRRQNGSTMKPLLDYGPAIENGLLSPGTILADLPTAYPGRPPYTPHNYGASGNGLFHGFETARTALAQSHNLPAIQTYYMNEHAFQPLDYLKKMGFSSLIYPDKGPLPVAIGGLTLGTTVEEDTNAYATFANGGNFVDAYMIEKIVDKNGKVVYQHKAKPVKVFTPQTSYMVIDMLRDVINRGTAAGLKGMLNFNSGDLYGKTGTTQNWNDSWMVAANPNMTLGVWNGFDQQAQLNPYTYHQHNSQIWASLANAAYKADPSLMVPKDQFKMPSGVVRTSFCGLTGGPVTPACKQAGMVSTDLVNVKYRPSKSSDGAFTNGKYVLINGKKFEALPTTPSVFTMGGTLLSESFIKTHFPYLEWDKISANPLKSALSVTPFKPDGRSPSPVSASLSNGKLSWSRSGSNDVVGYRIYQADNGSTNFHVIKEVMSDTQSVSAAQDGKAYYVTAVDITGKESAPSQKVNSGNWNPTPSVPTTPPAKGTGDGSGTGAPQNSNPITGNGSTDSNQNPPGTVSDQGTTTGQTVKTQSTTTTTTPNKP
ncbi:MAG TPA: penicillin-binding transpeptidase domain-containing protein, partial [Candidatus Angelobacter sp.]|nr:penicillin-binding transpeptidase domain-containing protein [Candidatus Angelobacter sp.]